METPEKRGTPAQGKGYGLKSSVWGHIVSVHSDLEGAMRNAVMHNYEGYPVEIVEMVCTEVTK